MRVIERRIDVECISPEALAQFIKFQGASYRTVAEEATRHLRLAGVKRSVSKATVGHLATGHTKRTHPDTAKAICKALNVPVGALFVARVSTVQRDVPGRAA